MCIPHKTEICCFVHIIIILSQGHQCQMHKVGVMDRLAFKFIVNLQTISLPIEVGRNH